MLTSWANVVVWVLPACIVGLAIVAGALWTLRGQRGCPSCRTPMRAAQPDPTTLDPRRPPSYEVLVCDTCSNCATLVHGHQSRFAYCPSCLNRSLRTPSIRQTDGSVRVEEQCELCGFTAERQVQTHAQPAAEEPVQLGVVIPFPTRPIADEDRADEA